tara:strand:+ start:381 stop:593 length:213 start_codon:yes stop_codon:yes gene_type:complete
MKLIRILVFLSFAKASIYSINDTISIEHQLMPFEVCYGNYNNNVLSLADFNGDLNGGEYKIIVLRSSFTW